VKVWITQIGEILPLTPEVRKMRTGYLAEHLQERGHEVTWWAAAFDHMSKKKLFSQDTEITIRPGLRIKAVSSPGYRKNVALSRYLDHMLLARRMRSCFLTEDPPDFIIASLPDHWTAYEAVIFGSSRKIPVLVDVRDEWPDVFSHFFPFYLRPLARAALVSDYRKVSRLLKKATGIVSMMDELLVWALKKAGRQGTWRDRVFYIGASQNNWADEEPISSRFRELASRLSGRCVFTFIGTMGSYYNPLILAEVAASLKDNDKLFFIIAGDGVYFDKVKRTVGDGANVFLPGWISDRDIRYLLSISHVGVIPCAERIDAFPNKAFTYLSAGLPLLSSVGGELEVLIERERLGFTYPVGDRTALAEMIVKLAEDGEARRQMAANARRIFMERYEADKIYGDFVSHIEGIAKHP